VAKLLNSNYFRKVENNSTARMVSVDFAKN